LARYANLPFYGNMLATSGFAAEVAAVRAAWQRRDVAAAEGAVTDEMADAVTLAGEPARCRERLAAYRSAGATLPIVFPNPVRESRAAAVERGPPAPAPHSLPGAPGVLPPRAGSAPPAPPAPRGPP